MNSQITDNPVSVAPASASDKLRPFRNTTFLIAAAVLLAAAIGLNASVSFLQLHFKKESVPLRVSFTDAKVMPQVIGPWVQVAREDTLDADMLASLATNEFLFCYYVNSAALGLSTHDVQKMMEGKNVLEQKVILGQLQRRKPTAVLQFSMTYYTGKPDTVAHIPERCYVGDGFDPVDPDTETWQVGDRRLEVRHITFQSTAANRGNHNVAYFFHTNGHYESDSLRVRATLQNLFARYGYYSKAELMCVTPGKEQEGKKERLESQQAMADFLNRALPSFEAALPDWSKYQGK
jgi:hypothetical protein